MTTCTRCNPLLPDRRDIIVPDDLGELAGILARHWPRLTRQALLEGPTNLLLETMHIEGQDYTFKQLRHFVEKSAGIGQEGVIASTDYDTTQRGAGANMSVDTAAGDAWVKMDTGTRNGFYLQTNDAVINTPVGAAHATLPRLDQLVLQINDSNVVGVSNTPELKILPGTATSGATLDNRTGAAALGNDRILIADILVPAAAASIVNTSIRDRRPWARGNAFHKRYTAGANLTTTSASKVRIDTVNLEHRVECSGAPLIVEVSAASYLSALGSLEWALAVDGVEQTGTGRRSSSGTAADASVTYLRWVLLGLAAGSHTFAPMWAQSGGLTATMLVTGGYAIDLSIYEIPRQSIENLTP